ncbi:hypothetical protein L1049_005194 [Liquidambar formosana]|uniref:Small ribosomal subunit protein uS15c n=1 Tax=Liquidambar formosana TaxID=63359 RepID=A0AAP0X1C3_LIQFO
MALQLRPKCRPITNPSFINLFSTSSSSNSTSDPKGTNANNTTTTTTTTSPSDSPPPPPPPSSQSQPSFSSYFSDVKASLRQQQPPPPKPSPNFSKTPISTPRPPTKIASLEEIRKNLSEFRRRSGADPPPPSQSSPPSSSLQISFQELYKRNVIGKPDESPAAEAGSIKAGGKVSFEAIRDSLRQMRSTSAAAATATNTDKKGADPMSLSAYRESFKLRPVDHAAPSSTVVIGGGSDTLPASVFGKEMRERKEGESSKSTSAMKTEFVKFYKVNELGEKLRMLRPKRKVGENWFSLEELYERLIKLRELEEKETDSKKVAGVTFKDLRESLLRLKMSDEEKAKKSSIQRLDILSQLGGTPNFLLGPPKEHLVEKYFHPDNMSSAEKMKIELKKVRDEYKMSESDCGSARVQVAQLTTKIKHLSSVLHKKDKHSRKGLTAMVQKRKKLLKYLRRTDWDSYCLVLSRLGLRDNPDYKN